MGLLRHASLALTPICAAQVIGAPARASDPVWSPRLAMGDLYADRLHPARADSVTGAAFHHSAATQAPKYNGFRTGRRAVGPLHAVIPSPATDPLHATAATPPAAGPAGAQPPRVADHATVPLATVQNWDIYASVSIGGFLDQAARPARNGGFVAPRLVLARKAGASRVILDATARAAIETSPRPGAAIAAHWLYRPADDVRIEAGAVAATRMAPLQPLLLEAAPEPWFLTHARTALAPGCDVYRAGADFCDYAAAGLRAGRRLGPVSLTASAALMVARADNGAPRPPRGSGVVASMRAASQVSHRLEPYLEATALWREYAHESAGRRRVIAGVRLPQLSLFDVSVFAGVDLAERSPALPAAGMEIGWSPRRTLTFGVLAESGSASASDTCHAPAISARTGGICVAGRLKRVVFTALWKPAERLEASLGVSRQHVAGASLWRGDGWRPQSRGKETTSEAWGRVAWMFAPRWRAQLDIAAATQSGSGRRSRRLSGNVSVTREL